MRQVAIIGTGPAGMLAAEAAQQAGAKVTLITDGKPSMITGAQYLHMAIPGLTAPEPDGFVRFKYIGTEEEYAQKLYGRPDAPTSWGRYTGLVPAWSLKTAYDTLRKNYEDRMMITQVEAGDIMDLVIAYDLVVNSAPRRIFCQHNHVFASAPLWVSTDSVDPIEPNSVVYLGDPAPCCRMSNIWGQRSFEYSQPWHGANKTYKPNGHACTCHGNYTNYLPVGRYGAWDRDQLTSDAFLAVTDALHKL